MIRYIGFFSPSHIPFIHSLRLAHSTQLAPAKYIQPVSSQLTPQVIWWAGATTFLLFSELLQNNIERERAHHFNYRLHILQSQAPYAPALYISYLPVLTVFWVKTSFSSRRRAASSRQFNDEFPLPFSRVQLLGYY